MKRIAILAALVIGVVAAPAVLAADAGSEGADNPYENAHVVDSPFGTLYGPVHAGPASSTSYGYISR